VFQLELGGEVVACSNPFSGKCEISQIENIENDAIGQVFIFFEAKGFSQLRIETKRVER
jgi:hypothetical protein